MIAVQLLAGGGGDRDDEQEDRERHHHLGQAGDDGVDPAAIVARERPRQHADETEKNVAKTATSSDVCAP